MIRKEKINTLLTRFGYLLSGVVILLASCSAQEEGTTLVVDTSAQYQTMEGFGASDAWRCQFVGKNWPEAKKEKIADLLFSKEFDALGKPKGIGLSIWRFNIGAGTTEQGGASDIKNEWRRAECFLQPDLTYNWSSQEGQKWFLHAAKKRGVDKFLAFPNSPPVYFTRNGKGYATKGDIRFNLKEGYEEKFADFLTEVIKYFKEKEKIHFDYISPVNEPQWDWDEAKQEGTPARNVDICKVVKALSSSITEKSLKTEITISEAAQIDFLYNTTRKKERNNQVEDFFSPESEIYVGDLPHVKKVIAGHSYFTTWPIEQQVKKRELLAKKIKETDPELSYWQSEYCILEKNDETVGGNNRDLGMNTALFVARLIHNDITIANASTWQWWTAVSQVDYKDGLVHLDLGGDNEGEWPGTPNAHKLKTNGELRETKTLWALGNYSLFIRPGMKRVDVSTLNTADSVLGQKGIQVSAYIDGSGDKLVIVSINHSQEKQQLNFVDKNGRRFLKGKNAKAYLTSKDRSLHPVSLEEGGVAIPPRSVLTVVLEQGS